MGGIATGVDAAEFLIAGATAVEVGTATFWDPQSPIRIARELTGFLRREGISDVSRIVRTLEL
jgi:dihydroorotate dehydrogenase (NAD+) catalytic subunit